MRQTPQKQHTVLRITENPCRECNLADFILIRNFANWKMLCLVLSMPKYNNSIIIVFKYKTSASTNEKHRSQIIPKNLNL